MTKDEIAKLPTPLSDAHYGEEWDGDGSSLCRFLEQRLAAAVMALEALANEDADYARINNLGDRPRHIDQQAFETLDAILGDK